MLFSEFKKTIESSQIIFEGCKIVAAVSGGADSMCLLHLLYRLRKVFPFQLTCAHVNHMLREEADEDASFVEEMCCKWKVPVEIFKTDVAARAKLNKISVELAGREERYSFFKSLNADCVMTAHTKNDVAESVLLHITRGSGLKGLCGIYKEREDGIFRPMLDFSREQIEAYLIQHHILWREDISNQDVYYTRNKIRHEIIPHFLEINPSFLDGIKRMTDVLEKENAFLEQESKQSACVKNEDDAYIISIPEICKMHIALQRRVISSLVETSDEVRSVLELAEKQSGKSVHLSGGKIAEREYNQIIIYKKKKKDMHPIKLPESGSVQFGSYRIIIGECGLVLPKKDYWIRAREPGDIFRPEGMWGHKKIKDFLIDKKIPKRLRDEIPIIMHEDKIAAVSDLRRDASFVPSDDSVIKIKVLKI